MLCRCRHNIHWTGSATRLHRIKRFEDRAGYAFEELVAEIGASFLAVQLGVAPSRNVYLARLDRNKNEVATKLEATLRDIWSPDCLIESAFAIFFGGAVLYMIRSRNT